jgi:hypothetical protein
MTLKITTSKILQSLTTIYVYYKTNAIRDARSPTRVYYGRVATLSPLYLLLLGVQSRMRITVDNRHD